MTETPHSPNDGPKDGTDKTQRKKLITLLATVLRAVHAALLQSLKTKREAREKKTLTPLEWFNLLSQETTYAWIRDLTRLLSDIDALLDNRPEISENDFAVVRNAVEALFGDRPVDQTDATPDPTFTFRDRYFDSLAADPELIMPNATLSRILRSWLVTPVTGDSEATRRDWHVGERRLAHLQASAQKTESKPELKKPESES